MKPILTLTTALSLLWLSACNRAPSSSEASEWLTSFADAQTLAAEQDRPLLLNFTGSDWCGPCIRMKKDVLATGQFAEFARENLVLLELDFPVRIRLPQQVKEQNAALSDEFNVGGYPTFILLNPQGEELARTVGYMAGGASRFLEWVEAARQESRAG